MKWSPGLVQRVKELQAEKKTQPEIAQQLSQELNTTITVCGIKGALSRADGYKRSMHARVRRAKSGEMRFTPGTVRYAPKDPNTIERKPLEPKLSVVALPKVKSAKPETRLAAKPPALYSKSSARTGLFVVSQNKLPHYKTYGHVSPEPTAENGFTITELSPTDCHWWIGRDLGGTLRFCGKPVTKRPLSEWETKPQDSPWCEEHHKIAVQHGSNRRRA